ncbi:MAG TPA: cytochrome c oxidase assembly protein [Verrucomicrobiae bacterium]|nr:cytochrome c oxidase assembly protein [Verrucomicrobiae bacterium]
MRTAALGASILAGVAVLAPVFDRLADQSFAWHMVQHLVLLFVVPFFVLTAKPFDAFRAIAGKRGTAAFITATRPLHVLAHPVVAFALFTGYLWFMHFSPLYEAALEHPLVHVAEHAMLVFVGTLFWLPVLAPPPLSPQPFPVRLFYLMLALPQGALLAFALGAARAPLYDHYASMMTARAALDDQRNGAAIMWIGGGLVIFVTLVAALGVWARRESIADRLEGEVA